MPRKQQKVAPRRRHSRPNTTNEKLLDEKWPAAFGARTCVLLVAVVCFANSIDGDFVFDDHEAVVNNPDAHSDVEVNVSDTRATPILDLFVHDFWGRDVRSPNSHKSYRPLTVLTFRFNHWWAGGKLESRMGYHTFNIVLHAVVSMLAFDFFSLILKEASRSDSTVASAAALLFAAHPVHTECVANIVGRAELLAALFWLLSFFVYSRLLLDNVDWPTSLFSWTTLFAGGLAAMLSKEQGVTVLLFCASFDFIRNWPTITAAARLLREHHTDVRNNNSTPFSKEFCTETAVRTTFSSLARILILLTIFLVLVLFRFWIMGFSSPTFNRLDNPMVTLASPIFRMLNYNYIYFLNLWLLINPSDLCFDYSMGCVSLIQSLFDHRLLLVLLLWTGAASLVFSLATNRNSRGAKQLTLSCTALTVVTYLPASNIFFSVGFVLAERVLYLPSLGFCLFAAYAVLNSLRQLQASRLVKPAFCLLLLLFVSKSLLRSDEWRDELRLYESGARVCPNNAKIHYNLGKLLADRGQRRDAENEYRTAIRLEPTYEQPMNNLANLLMMSTKRSEQPVKAEENDTRTQRHRNLEAEQWLSRAVEQRPAFATAWMNLGLARANLGRHSDAEQAYQRAILLRGEANCADCHFNLANLYLDMGRHSAALHVWETATKIRPTHCKAWINRIILLDNMNQCGTALSVGKEALSRSVECQKNGGVHFSLAGCLGQLSRYGEAENHYLTAIELSSDNANYYGNLGVLYHRWGDRSSAAAMYQKALHLQPNLDGIRQNFDMLKRNRTHYR